MLGRHAAASATRLTYARYMYMQQHILQVYVCQVNIQGLPGHAAPSF
jgi:hypothetical protein